MPPKPVEYRVKNPDAAVRLAAELAAPIEVYCSPKLAKLIRTEACRANISPVAYLGQHNAVASAITGPGLKYSVSASHAWRASPRMWAMQVSTSGGGKTLLYISQMRVINAHELRVQSRYQQACPNLVQIHKPTSLVAGEVSKRHRDWGWWMDTHNSKQDMRYCSRHVC